MLLSSFEGQRLAARLHRLRGHSLAAYAIAFAAVAVATLIRWAIGEYVPGRIPFTLYFPAIVIAALAGGFWPGMLAIVLSALAACLLFILPSGWGLEETVSLLTYALVSLLIVGVVAALNWALDRLLIEIAHRHDKELAAAQLAAIVEFSEDAIVAKDLDGTITNWNRGAERLFGYSAEEAIGKPITILIPPDRFDEEPGILERVRRGERVDHYDTVRLRKDGTLIDISLSISPMKDSDGKIVGASKIARDVTERKRLQEQQKLIVSEMRHRIKNSLATIQAVANQTVKDVGERDAFISRLHALDRAYDVLTTETWEKAALSATINRALEPFHAHLGTRITLDGTPHIWLEAAKALMVAMMMHELGTNAVKYGALSNATGRVNVAWERLENPDLVKIVWRESGGPPVTAPKRKGFGSHVIERVFGGQLGRAQLEFKSPGLLCTVEIAL
jgi:PAS domain S-box-containing protein